MLWLLYDFKLRVKILRANLIAVSWTWIGRHTGIVWLKLSYTIYSTSAQQILFYDEQETELSQTDCATAA